MTELPSTGDAGEENPEGLISPQWFYENVNRNTVATRKAGLIEQLANSLDVPNRDNFLHHILREH